MSTTTPPSRTSLHVLLALSCILTSGCTHALDYAATYYPDAAAVMDTGRHCPGGTTHSKFLVKDGEEFGYVCCRGDRCETVDLDGNPVESNGEPISAHIY